MKKQIKDTDYLAISARIRAMENMLLTQPRMEKILEAAMKDPCLETNPVKPEACHLRGILEAVAGRG